MTAVLSAPETFDIFSNFATDEVLEVEGKWFPLGKSARIKVARTGNDRYNTEFKKLLEQYQADLSDGGPAAEALAAKIITEVQAKTVLVDWENLSYQGKPVPYSVEMAKTFLGVKDFRKRVTALADSFENFRVKAEEQQGNA
jgi:hypothetical protein